MSNEVSNKEPIHIPKVLSIEGIPLEKRPTPQDWVLIQGGMPKVVPIDLEKGLFNVVHEYVNMQDPQGTGAIVPSSAPLIEKWEVKIIRMRTPDNRIIEAPTALLWKYHGRGCEARSNVQYDRVKVEAK